MWFRFNRLVIKRFDPLIKNSLLQFTSASSPMKHQDKLAAHQQSLPRLPVPPLHPSLEKYLLSVRPLLTEDEYHTTEKIVKEFGAPGGLGVKLHNLLKEKAKSTENWLEEWWLNSAYLEFRMPVVMYSNPGLVFPLKDFNSKEKQLRYAARLVAGALDYKRNIDNCTLPLDKMGDQPLDMSQYFRIFSSCRIPGHPKDSLAFFGMKSEKPKHIIVVHNNHYFSVDVYGDDGAPLNESQLFEQFKLIVEQSKFPKSPIGVLTSLHRDAWAKAYKRLCKSDIMNKESIKKIQESIFLLCLDNAILNYDKNDRLTHAALQIIHGGGSKGNVGNRWYDKTIQFIISEDGVIGINYEHSPAEALPVATMADHILQYIEKTKGNKWLPSVNPTKPLKLRFKLSEETLQDIEVAEKDIDILVNDLEMSCFSYEQYGKDFIKSQKLSPDSFIQMAIQLAYFKMHGNIAATYETASSRKFFKGRTETIRSASIEALDFCKLMMDKSLKPHIKAAALRSAVDAHKEYTLQAINGLGIDRLLLGLKKIALELEMNVPEIFLDTGFTTSTHFKLSTSQIPSKASTFSCYGPLVPDGYGCSYNPLAFSINFGLSACNSSPETNSKTFKNFLNESLNEMHGVIIQSQKSKL